MIDSGSGSRMTLPSSARDHCEARRRNAWPVHRSHRVYRRFLACAAVASLGPEPRSTYSSPHGPQVLLGTPQPMIDRCCAPVLRCMRTTLVADGALHALPCRPQDANPRPPARDPARFLHRCHRRSDRADSRSTWLPLYVRCPTMQDNLLPTYYLLYLMLLG
jgi:hypothetical protein